MPRGEKNIGDYAGSPIQAVTPGEFLKTRVKEAT